MPTNVENMIRVYGPATWDLYDLLEQSLEPRGPDSLLDVAAAYIRAGAVILDAGCRDAKYLVRLVEKCQASGVGVDPVPIHIERATKTVQDAGLDSRVTVLEGVIHDLPYPAGYFDFVWCRDVVEQLDDLPGALAELCRVLKLGRHMLVFTVFATDRLEPKETGLLNQHLGNVAENLIEEAVESAFSAAGFAIEEKQDVCTEWREYAEERSQPVSRALLRLSRLRRQQEAITERFGQEIYDHVEANLHWEIYQFLGKLRPVIYVLRNNPH